MAPTNPHKRKSDEMEEQTVGAVTPTGSPAHKKMRITQQQKQALMDNLQLEITERARQLRAGYALQCADLRARIERRVNRIPLSTRKMTMGELMQQHEATTNKKQQIPRASPPRNTVTVEIPAPKPLPPLPQGHSIMNLPSPIRQPQPAPTRAKKNMSPEIQIATDKENEQEYKPDTLPVLKNTKRAKAAPPARGTRTTSRTQQPPSVLSPRSHNSGTLPRSPIKEVYLPPISPAKSMIARPTTNLSPIRPTSPLKSAATAATSAISASVHGMIEHAKRGGTATTTKLTRTASNKGKKDTITTANAAISMGQMLPPPKPTTSAASPSSPQRAFSQASTHSNSTDISTASSGTTVIKPKRAGRPAAALKAPKVTSPGPAEKKKTGIARAASAAKTALRKNANALSGTAAVGKKVVVAEPAVGRRVLRKRA